MKVNGSPAVPAKEIAVHLDITSRRVRQLMTDGVLDRTAATLDEHRLSYIRYQRKTIEEMRGRKNVVEAAKQEGTLESEKLRLTRAQAENTELKNAITKAEYAPVELFTHVLSKIGGEISGELDSLPLAIKRKHQLDTIVIEDIKRICVRAANAIATKDSLLEEFLSEYIVNTATK